MVERSFSFLFYFHIGNSSGVTYFTPFLDAMNGQQAFKGNVSYNKRLNFKHNPVYFRYRTSKKANCSKKGEGYSDLAMQ